VTAIEIGGRRVGPDERLLVIAEAGVNHDGDVERALALVDAAAASGADAVKFQTFDAAELAARSAPLAEYQRSGADADQVEMLARLSLDGAAFARIAERCRARGVLFLSTPFDRASAQLLDDLGVPAFKVGSGELTNLPFLRSLARRGLPLLVSTGMADMGDVDAAVEAIRASGGPPLALLHCVSSYPAPPEQANLRAIATLRTAFDVPVGYSDHCLGLDVSLASVALGACILERHLTLDRSLPGPDHAMSLEPDELAELVRRARAVQRALGDGRKVAQPAERDTMAVARRSIVAARDLAAGELLDERALAIKRPAGGLEPGRLDSVLGARLARALARDEQLTDAHLERP